MPILSKAFVRLKGDTSVSVVSLALDTTTDILQALETVPLAGPVLHAAVKVLQTIDGVRTNTDDLANLAKRVEGLAKAIKRRLTGSSLKTIDITLESDLNQLELTFDEIADFLQKNGTRKFWKKFLVNKAIAGKIRDFNRSLDLGIESLKLRNEIQILQHVQEIAAKLPDPEPPVLHRRASILLASLPPRPQHVYGRDQQRDLIADTILSTHPARVCIRGSGGIGKSALALMVMHHPQIVQKFGKRRMFVRLDAATSAHGILTAILTRFGDYDDIQSAPESDSDTVLANRVYSLLCEPPDDLLLTLDNFETPWEANRETVEELLFTLCSFQHITIIVTVRGRVSPYGAEWTKMTPPLQPLEPLSPESARQFLVSVLGDRDANWDAWELLLEEVGYVPLAVRLLADHVRNGEDPRSLLLRWQAESDKLRLLQRSGDETRENSVTISVQLSLTSNRQLAAHPYAKELLSMLSLLPDGIGRQELSEICTGLWFDLDEALSILTQAALLEDVREGESRRLRVLALIRLYMQRHQEHDSVAAESLVSHFVALAMRGDAIRDQRTDVVVQLTPQAGNLQSILHFALSCNPQPSKGLLEATRSFITFVYYSNVGSINALEEAILAHLNRYTFNGLIFDHIPPEFSRLFPRWSNVTIRTLLAQCLKGLADVHLRRCQYKEASQGYTGASRLFRSLGDLFGEAACIIGMADTHFESTQLGASEEEYRKALVLLRPHAQDGGLARCYLGLANIDLRRFQLDDAEKGYLTAMKLFECEGDVYGEGRCVLGLAEVHIGHADLDNAALKYETALEVFATVNDKLGEGRSRTGLADIHLRRSQLNEAEKEYNHAHELFSSVGELTGEGDCLIGLGNVDLAFSQLQSATVRFELAKKTFKKVASVLGEAKATLASANAYAQLSEPDRAKEAYKHALLLFEGAGDPLGCGDCLLGVAGIQLQQGYILDGERTFSNALQFYLRARNKLGEAECQLGMAELHMQQYAMAEDPKERYRLLLKAKGKYDAALEIFDGRQVHRGEGSCLRGLASISVHQGDYDKAVTLFAQAGEAFFKGRELVGGAECLVGTADVYCRRADLDGASNDYVTAVLDAAEEMYVAAMSVFGKAKNPGGQRMCEEGLGRTRQRRFAIKT